MLIEYDKGVDHINAWDTYHFVTLLASCDFAMENYIPTEGVVVPRLRIFNIFHRKKGGIYVDRMNRRMFRNLCYTQHFMFRKVKDVKIRNTD